MPGCEVPHCALDYEHVVPYEPQCERFNKRFSTYVIAYNPDTASFVVTDRRIFCWQHRAEFDTVKEGIEYFEKHVNRFIDTADAFRNKAAFTVACHGSSQFPRGALYRHTADARSVGFRITITRTKRGSEK